MVDCGATSKTRTRFVVNINNKTSFTQSTTQPMKTIKCGRVVRRNWWRRWHVVVPCSQLACCKAWRRTRANRSTTRSPMRTRCQTLWARWWFVFAICRVRCCRRACVFKKWICKIANILLLSCFVASITKCKLLLNDELINAKQLHRKQLESIKMEQANNFLNKIAHF